MIHLQVDKDIHVVYNNEGHLKQYLLLLVPILLLSVQSAQALVSLTAHNCIHQIITNHFSDIQMKVATKSQMQAPQNLQNAINDTVAQIENCLNK